LYDIKTGLTIFSFDRRGEVHILDKKYTIMDFGNVTGISLIVDQVNGLINLLYNQKAEKKDYVSGTDRISLKDFGVLNKHYIYNYLDLGIKLAINKNSVAFSTMIYNKNIISRYVSYELNLIHKYKRMNMEEQKLKK